MLPAFSKFSRRHEVADDGIDLGKLTDLMALEDGGCGEAQLAQATRAAT